MLEATALDTGNEFVAMAMREGLTLERSSNASGYRNVHFNRAYVACPYQAQFRTPGALGHLRGIVQKTTHLGYFPSAEEAALVIARHRREMAIKDALAEESDSCWWKERGLVRETDGLQLRLSRQSVTGYKCVIRDHDGKYRARIETGINTGNLGRYETAVEAAVAVAKFYRGELSPRAAYEGEARRAAATQAQATRRANRLEQGLDDLDEEAEFERLASLDKSSAHTHKCASPHTMAVRKLAPDKLARYRKWCARLTTRRYRERHGL